MIKTKIKTILPYWLIGVLVLAGFQIFGPAIIVGPSQSLENEKTVLAAEPQVLGAFTDIRGANEPILARTKIALKQSLDLTALSAKSFIAYDLETGQILAEKDPDRKLPIASLTKLVTALVVYEKTDLGSFLVVSPSDVVTIKPNLGLLPGDTVKIGDLLNAMLVGSCNDAALTLANYVEKITSRDFVAIMNEKAGNLGMADSLFSNPIGFDIKQNYSTAQDLQKLVTATQNLGVFTSLSKLTGYSFINNQGKEYKTLATNKLVSKYSDVEAVKTGFTQNAQGSMITKLQIGNRQIVLIIIGTDNREKDTLELRRQMLADYTWE